ncbi:MAG: ribosome small subunit-dependent GTPase A [Clostridia bacterium]|nr:ribosome small subunit-dependent GTPase A [Clostridia bacterium]
MLSGLIRKGIGGFYYVDTPQGIYASKARGLFRKKGQSPLVGDRVEIEVTHEGDREAYIKSIAPRRNALIRPPVANLERLFIVSACRNPQPSALMIDKLIAICEKKEIDPVVVFNKCDLGPEEELGALYRRAGFAVVMTSAEQNEGIEELAALIEGKLCAFAGHSGVGKSSLLNRLNPQALAEVGDLSARLERGKHTTRHVEIFTCAGGYLADTPGFGDISFERFEPVYKEELPDCFREFAPYLGQCRFAGCVHDKEPDCAVKAAVASGEIAKSRHQSYLSMLDDVRDIKEWEK